LIFDGIIQKIKTWTFFGTQCNRRASELQRLTSSAVVGPLLRLGGVSQDSRSRAEDALGEQGALVQLETDQSEDGQ